MSFGWQPDGGQSRVPEESGGAAGASARREHERRRAKDEARTRAEWGRFGKIAVALTPERTSTRVWSTGAEGEERVGARLDAVASASIKVLHDRRIPRSRANIDHLVVTPAAVWVIDTKRYQNQKPERRIEGGLFRPRIEKLYLGGRDRTALVEGVLRQVDIVKAALPEHTFADVPVRGALCFVDSDWGLLADVFTVHDVLAVWPKKMVKTLSRETEGNVDVAGVSERLRAVFLPS